MLGTSSYMAPEIHLTQPYQGAQVDLFAAAVILFIMVAGHPPFSEASPKD
jgi:serine/threonine protein kinase